MRRVACSLVWFKPSEGALALRPVVLEGLGPARPAGPWLISSAGRRGERVRCVARAPGPPILLSIEVAVAGNRVGCQRTSRGSLKA